MFSWSVRNLNLNANSLTFVSKLTAGPFSSFYNRIFLPSLKVVLPEEASVLYSPYPRGLFLLDKKVDEFGEEYIYGGYGTIVVDEKVMSDYMNLLSSSAVNYCPVVVKFNERCKIRFDFVFGRSGFYSYGGEPFFGFDLGKYIRESDNKPLYSEDNYNPCKLKPNSLVFVSFESDENKTNALCDSGYGGYNLSSVVLFSNFRF